MLRITCEYNAYNAMAEGSARVGSAQFDKDTNDRLGYQ